MIYIACVMDFVGFYLEKWILQFYGKEWCSICEKMIHSCKRTAWKCAFCLCWQKNLVKNSSSFSFHNLFSHQKIADSLFSYIIFPNSVQSFKWQVHAKVAPKIINHIIMKHKKIALTQKQRILSKNIFYEEVVVFFTSVSTKSKKFHSKWKS